LVNKSVVHPGGTVMMGLTRISSVTLQTLGAERRTRWLAPRKIAGGIAGLVWNDFSPLQDLKYDDDCVRRAWGYQICDSPSSVRLDPASASTATNSSGDFSFSHVAPGSYHVEILASNFQNAFRGHLLARIAVDYADERP